MMQPPIQELNDAMRLIKYGSDIALEEAIGCIERTITTMKNDKSSQVSIDSPGQTIQVEVPKFTSASSEIPGVESSVAKLIREHTNCPGEIGFKLMAALKPYLRTSEPVSVEVCVEAMREITHPKGDGHPVLHSNREAIKAVLDASGVKYVD